MEKRLTARILALYRGAGLVLDLGGVRLGGPVAFAKRSALRDDVEALRGDGEHILGDLRRAVDAELAESLEK